jgi:hypothetical protein
VPPQRQGFLDGGKRHKGDITRAPVLCQLAALYNVDRGVSRHLDHLSALGGDFQSGIHRFGRREAANGDGADPHVLITLLGICVGRCRQPLFGCGRCRWDRGCNSGTITITASFDKVFVPLWCPLALCLALIE